jgi:phosphoglycerate kinase
MKKTVKDVEVNGKRVLVRVDFNVPMEDGKIVDDGRIRASLPTIRYLIEQRAKVILLSQLGRPSGFVVENLRMNPIAEHLTNLLHTQVAKVNNCVGPEVDEAIQAMEPGQVLLLENVRFHPGEMVNDPHFAARLASCADIFVNDAFASANRTHASIVGVARHLPAVAGLLMESELQGLRRVQSLIHPPVVVLLGGARLIDKAHFVDDNLEHHNLVLLGGVLANTFLHAKGLEVGQSKVEKEVLVMARNMLAGSPNLLVLPVDVVIADAFTADAHRRTVAINHMPSAGWIVDIGPRTVERYSQAFEKARTVIWNGMMGTGALPTISTATETLARKIASLKNTTKIAGGGNTMAVLDRLGLSGQMDYLSTGGAAFLEGLENDPLPGVEVLQNKEEENLVRKEGSAQK